MKEKSAISDTFGSSKKARKAFRAVTPTTEEKRPSNADEAMVLHLVMVLALFQVNNNNINTDLTAETIKEQLDNSKMLQDSGFPALDADILQLAFGKCRAKLEKKCGMSLTEYKSSDNTQNAVVGGLGNE